MRCPFATAALLAATACGAPPEPGGGAAPDTSDPPADARPLAPPPETAPAERPAEPAAGAPADTLPELRLVSREPLRGRIPTDLGLTGRNKLNPVEERFRRGIPPETPAWIPRTRDGLDLFLADSVEGGWLALYRGSLVIRPGARNSPYRAALFEPGGEVAWDLDLGAHLSRPDHLEVQDLRYADGALYFNEACQSYSREAGGRCSSLVRLDPRTGRVAWRTRPRVSNNVFILYGPWVVAGYGFTAEPDSVFLVDRGNGRIVARAPLDTAASYLEADGPRLTVLTRDSVYTYRVEGREVPSS